MGTEGLWSRLALANEIARARIYSRGPGCPTRVREFGEWNV